MEHHDPRRYEAFLRQRLEDAREELTCAESGRRDVPLESARCLVFVIATSLSTFGELSLAELGLRHVPVRGLVRRLAGTLPGFLPFPDTVDPVRDPTRAAEWLQANHHNLRWVPDSHFHWAHES